MAGIIAKCYIAVSHRYAVYRILGACCHNGLDSGLVLVRCLQNLYDNQ